MNAKYSPLSTPPPPPSFVHLSNPCHVLHFALSIEQLCLTQHWTLHGRHALFSNSVCGSKKNTHADARFWYTCAGRTVSIAYIVRLRGPAVGVSQLSALKLRQRRTHRPSWAYAVVMLSAGHTREPVALSDTRTPRRQSSASNAV